jgi:hypothetical protein
VWNEGQMALLFRRLKIRSEALQATNRWAGRPRGERNDCAVLAIAIAAERTYAETLSTFEALGRKTGRRTPPAVIARVADALGLVRSDCHLPAREFLRSVAPDVTRLAAFTADHAFATVGGVRVDEATMDYDPRAVVLYYYRREEAEKFPQAD